MTDQCDRIADTRGIRAVLFDVDGTLYRQLPVRACMVAELAAAATLAPARTRRSAATLVAFRRTREELRSLGHGASSLELVQYARTADTIGANPDQVRAIVEEWMLRRPLKYLRAARRRPMAALIERLSRRGIRSGVFSDYPAADKVDALGLAGFFSLTLCSTDPDINAFKPHPRGFLRACAMWRLAPEEVLYVGDRADTDGAGAQAAGMPAVVFGGIGGRRDDGRNARHRVAATLAELGIP